MNTLNKKPRSIIRIDKNTKKIHTPDLFLYNQSGEQIIGKISNYTNWNINLIGNGLDEISFDIHKYVNGIKNPVWDNIVDLKTVLVDGFSQFEIDVNYTDNTETVKSVHGVSKENELGQLYLYDFHVNDEEATTMEITEYNQDDFDEHGNFIPTVFYDEDDPTHSLLHRVLKDKAPHWSLGYITPYIALNEEDNAELSNKFQRTYTADGDSIYDFLTGTVAEESNVIFVFDTINRVINCYSLCDCYLTNFENVRELVESSIGSDTTILVSKNKIANEITISSNKDSIKNCFRIEGGDDVITDYVRAANINGSNYIYRFADFQLNDMPSELKQKILDYQELIEANKSAYIGENGIFTRLCSAYDDLAYYTSEMMPNVTLEPTTAEEQYDNVRQELQLINVGVSKLSIYDSTSFQSVTNNVLAMAQVLLDSRYNIEVIDDYTTYDGITHIWSGNFRIVRASDETDYYPKTEMDKSDVIGVQIDDDETLFVKQKLLKALSKTDMTEIDFFVEEIWEDSQLTDEEKRQEIYDYFDEYALNRLTSFQKGYASCIGLLTQVGHATTGLTEDGVETASTVRDELYDKYKTYQDIVNEVLEKRQGQVDNINDEITNLKEEQLAFQENMNFPNYLGEELYHTFLKYCREDTYSNDNFISEGLSDAEILQKAQELIDAANKEIGKACVLQRTVSTSLNNLLLLPEFEPLYENFSLFNYIRVKTEDEIIKLRLLEISFSGESASEIDVTFSEQIESVDGNLSDLQSILQQASSIASSYSSTTLQAKQGQKANNQWKEVYETGLNAARTAIKNSDNNEVTITEAGIYCKRMDDEGLYGDKQLAVVGNMIAFTKNNWQSVELAIGETTIINPITGNTSKSYGVVAESIVGKLLVGESLYVGNSDGSVQITGNGINVKKSSNNQTVFSVDNNGNGYYSGKLEISNAQNKIIIDPSSRSLLSVTKGNTSVLSLGTNGNLTVSGEIQSESGNIGGWQITNDGLKYETSNNDFLALYSSSKSIVSQNGNYKATFTSGNIRFSINNVQYSSFTAAQWSGTNYYGTDVRSEVDSKFVAFGNKENASDTEYTTTLLLNYGLNPKGNTQDVLIFGSSKISGDFYFGNDTYLSGNFYFNNDTYLNALIGGGIYCSSKLSTSGNLLVGNVNYGNGYKLQVNGDSYFNGKIYAKSIYEDGDNISTLYRAIDEPFTMIINHNDDYRIVLTDQNNLQPRDFNNDNVADIISIGSSSSVYYKAMYAKAFTTVSDRNLKENIEEISDVYETFFNKLVPVSYKYKNIKNNDTHDRTHIGFIAQDVKQAIDDSGMTSMDFAGYVYSDPNNENKNEGTYNLSYPEFIALNTHMIQKLYKRVEELEEYINELKGENN